MIQAEPAGQHWSSRHFGQQSPVDDRQRSSLLQNASLGTPQAPFTHSRHPEHFCPVFAGSGTHWPTLQIEQALQSLLLAQHRLGSTHAPPQQRWRGPQISPTHTSPCGSCFPFFFLFPFFLFFCFPFFLFRAPAWPKPRVPARPQKTPPAARPSAVRRLGLVPSTFAHRSNNKSSIWSAPRRVLPGHVG